MRENHFLCCRFSFFCKSHGTCCSFGSCLGAAGSELQSGPKGGRSSSHQGGGGRSVVGPADVRAQQLCVSVQQRRHESAGGRRCVLCPGRIRPGRHGAGRSRRRLGLRDLPQPKRGRGGGGERPAQRRGGELLRLHRLRAGVPPARSVGAARADAPEGGDQGRQVVHVRHLRQKTDALRRLPEAPAGPHGREAVLLRPVRPQVQRQLQLQAPLPHARRAEIQAELRHRHGRAALIRQRDGSST